MPYDVLNIFKDGLLMAVHVRRWSGAKQLNPQDLGLKPEDVAEAYRLGKKMLIPDEVLAEFRKIEGQARYLIDRNSFHFTIGNAQFVPHNKVESIQTQLQDFHTLYMALADKLVENYDKHRQEMVPVYLEAAENAFIRSTPENHTFGIDYDREKEKKNFIDNFMQRLDSYYPSAESLRARFDLSWDAFEITVPKSSLSAEYQAQMESRIREFVDDVVKTLRQETLEVCAKVQEALESKKVVHGKTLNSMANFIDHFKELNFIGDTEMEQMLEKLRKDILSKYTPSNLKDNAELKAELRRRIQKIKEHAEFSDVSKVTGQYKRRINWEDNVSAASTATPVSPEGPARKIQVEAKPTQEPVAQAPAQEPVDQEPQEGASITEIFKVS